MTFAAISWWEEVQLLLYNGEMQCHLLYKRFCLIPFKDGLLFKIKNLHIHLYFIATLYALVEDTGNWTRSYIIIIIYWNRQKNNIQRVSLKRFLVLAGYLKVVKPMLCWCFFFKTHHNETFKKGNINFVCWLFIYTKKGHDIEYIT